MVGRYTGIPRVERLCKICDTMSMGDEFHYIFQCTAFDAEKAKYIHANLSKHPNTLNMEILFNDENPSYLANLATFYSIIMATMRDSDIRTHKPYTKHRIGKRTTKGCSYPQPGKNAGPNTGKPSNPIKNAYANHIMRKIQLKDKVCIRKQKKQKKQKKKQR